MQTIQIDLGDGSIAEPVAEAVAEAVASGVKRSLMSFDKLNRLAAKSGGRGSAGKENLSFIGQLGQVAEKSVEYLQAVSRYMREAVQAAIPWEQKLKAISEKLQQSTLPMTNFIRGLMGISPAVLQTADSMARLDEQTLFTAGLIDMVPLKATGALQKMQECFSGADSWFKTHVADPLAAEVKSLFSTMPNEANLAWNGTKQVFLDCQAFFRDTFRQAWDGVLDVFSDTDSTFTTITGGVIDGIKNAVNRLIDGINSAIINPFAGLNSALNKLKSFSIGGFQPFKNLNFSLSMPSIPHLASGAVLPANKPFLAMVGDQKHGTNIEAPLSTIEQAVAGVMEGMVEADMAGHNATVSVLRQILEAVLCIRLDEGTLGRAVGQYMTRQSVMTGGF